jgi:predicted hotdog family 3-hydroxylacyl-ACP dehydratase
MSDAPSLPPGPLLSVLPPIEELIPHRAPMSLLDHVVSTDGHHIVCALTIRDGATFVENGRVPATVAIEYMAQAAAAWLGALARSRAEPTGSSGFLVGLREVVLHVDAFVRGEQLEVHAHHTWGSEAFMSFDCKVVIAGRDVATATLNVLRTLG